MSHATFDPLQVELATRLLLGAIEPHPYRDGVCGTPERLSRSWAELVRGYGEDPESILSARFKAKYDEMVVLSPIEFWSTCEHHLLPFHGVAKVGYVPNGEVVGLSKLARLVHCFARRLQLQEQLTQQIAEALNDHLKPRGVGVVLEATHLCMAARGVKTPSRMTTSCLLGVMRSDPAARAEFLRLGSKSA